MDELIAEAGTSYRTVFMVDGESDVLNVTDDIFEIKEEPLSFVDEFADTNQFKNKNDESERYKIRKILFRNGHTNIVKECVGCELLIADEGDELKRHQ